MLDNQLFTELTPEQGSQLVGGQFTIILEEVGVIPAPPESELSVSDVGPNPTAIQVVNQTELDLSYGLNYGKFEDVAIPAGATRNHFGQTELAAAGWDKDLRQPHIQLDIALMKPGYQYAFKRV